MKLKRIVHHGPCNESADGRKCLIFLKYSPSTASAIEVVLILGCAGRRLDLFSKAQQTPMSPFVFTSKFINGLNKCGITIDRKILAEIAYDSPEAFKTIVQKAQSALN